MWQLLGFLLTIQANVSGLPPIPFDDLLNIMRTPSCARRSSAHIKMVFNAHETNNRQIKAITPRRTPTLTLCKVLLWWLVLIVLWLKTGGCCKTKRRLASGFPGQIDGGAVFTALVATRWPLCGNDPPVVINKATEALIKFKHRLSHWHYIKTNDDFNLRQMSDFTFLSIWSFSGLRVKCKEPIMRRSEQK